MPLARRAAAGLAALALLAACNSGPKKPDQPLPPSPIKGRIDAARNAANTDSAALKQSEDRMNAQAAEAAGDTSAKPQ